MSMQPRVQFFREVWSGILCGSSENSAVLVNNHDSQRNPQQFIRIFPTRGSQLLLVVSS